MLHIKYKYRNNNYSKLKTGQALDVHDDDNKNDYQNDP